MLWDDEKVDLLSPWDMEPILAPVEGEEDGEGGRGEGGRGGGREEVGIVFGVVFPFRLLPPDLLRDH